MRLKLWDFWTTKTLWNWKEFMRHKTLFMSSSNIWKAFNWMNNSRTIKVSLLKRQKKFWKDYFKESVIWLQKESSTETLNLKILCSEEKNHFKLLSVISDLLQLLTKRSICLSVVVLQVLLHLRSLILKI